MRREVVLDIETQNTFQDVGAYNPSLLSISVIGVYFYETDTFESFFEADLPKLWPRLEHERSLGDLRRKALNAKGYDRSKAWKDFYAYKNLFADLVPGYWSTVHKAQGSTFAHAYVFFGDICRNPKVSERNRMVYTAYTRAAKKLLIAH
jgi:hypothetical protein